MLICLSMCFVRGFLETIFICDLIGVLNPRVIRLLHLGAPSVSSRVQPDVPDHQSSLIIKSAACHRITDDPEQMGTCTSTPPSVGKRRNCTFLLLITLADDGAHLLLLKATHVTNVWVWNRNRCQELCGFAVIQWARWPWRQHPGCQAQDRWRVGCSL